MLTLPFLVWHLVQWPLSKMFVVIRKYESCLVPLLHLCFVCILHWFPSFKDSPDDDAFFEEGKPLHCITESAFPPAEFWTTNTTFYLYPFILYVSIMLILCLNASFSCFDFCCIFLCQQLRTRRVEWATSPASVEKKRVELNMRLTLVTPLFSLLGKPSCANSAVFLNIVQTAFDPPLPRFEHVCCKFFWTTFKKVRKRLSRQNSTK